MKPIGKYILLTPVKEEVKTESGILLSADDVDNKIPDSGKGRG